MDFYSHSNEIKDNLLILSSSLTYATFIFTHVFKFLIKKIMESKLCQSKVIIEFIKYLLVGCC